MKKTLTTREAAEMCGLTPGGFRRSMALAREKGNDLRVPADQWPDQRTPLYDAAKVRRWADNRRVYNRANR